MLIRVRDTEACEPRQSFVWDTVFYNRLDASGGYGDWILAGDKDPAEQRGGLRARAMLATAVMLQLLTDARLPEGMRNPGDDGDPRGWWGDSIKLDDEPPNAQMGSLLWTLERSTLSQATADAAKVFCERSLQVLIDQGAASRFDVAVSVDIDRGLLAIRVTGFDNAGRPLGNPFVYDILWNQVRERVPSSFLSVR